MRTTAAAVALISLTACATPPAADESPPVQAEEKCAEAMTGSRIRQCNRGDVKVMTREEIERNPTWLQKPEEGPTMPKR